VSFRTHEEALEGPGSLEDAITRALGLAEGLGLHLVAARLSAALDLLAKVE
jgi:hypothetical protein